MSESQKGDRIEILESQHPVMPGDVGVEKIERLRHLPGRRSVWKAVLDGKSILLKCYHPHPKQARDARLEWDNASTLSDLGLPTARPLFYGKGEGRELVVAFEYLEDGVALDDYFAMDDPQDAPRVLEALVQLHVDQHLVGCWQEDDHLGNYLWCDEKLWMLDAGTCQFRAAPLDEKRKNENWAMLAANISFRWIPELIDALKTCEAPMVQELTSVYRDAVRLRRDRYLKKTQRACSEFECQSRPGYRWLARRDIAPVLKGKLMSNPDQFFSEKATMLKSGNTCSVVEIEEEGRKYVLKRYNQKSWLYRLRHIMMRPRALSSWMSGQVLTLFGILTPLPVACLLLKSGPIFRCGYLLMEKIEGVSLLQVPVDQMSDLSQVLPREFARRWSELSVLDATHGDMKGSNFMVNSSGQLVLIDLDSLKFHTSKQELNRRKQKDLKRFMKNWERCPDVQHAYAQALLEVD